MTMATINGVELFYDEHGSGEPVLIHHGYNGSHYSWDDVVPVLSKQFHVFRMDCRGCGDSSHPADGHTFEQYAADVIGMADHLGLAKFSYIGHSMGGVVGYELGLTYSGRLNKLVLVTPAPADGVQMPPAMRAAGEALRAAKDVETIARAAMAMSATPLSYEEAVKRITRDLSSSEAHYHQSWEAISSYSKGDRLGEIKVPTLMIAGAADFLMTANLKDFQRLGNATLHVFSGVSHGVPYEIPETFANVVADFLTRGVVTAATLQANMLATAGAR